MFFYLFFFAFGVSIVTSDEGPGGPLGNLYYFSWISFISSFLLGSSCYEDFQSLNSQSETNSRDSPDIKNIRDTNTGTDLREDNKFSIGDE